MSGPVIGGSFMPFKYEGVLSCRQKHLQSAFYFGSPSSSSSTCCCPPIWALLVLRGDEGRGIGSALHDAAVDCLWSREAARIWLSTAPQTRAERLYRDFRWCEVTVPPSGEKRLELPRPILPVGDR